MKESLALWPKIIGSPSKGFGELKPETKIIMPLLIVLVLIIGSSCLLLPVLNSDAYSKAVGRAQINALKERGTEMSAEQIDAMQAQLQSKTVKTITTLSSTVGSAVGYLISLIISVVLLKLLLLIFGEKTAFKLLFKIIVYIAVISIVQMILKNVITIATDYERLLSRVQHTSDLQYAITSQISLAALLTPGKTNPVVFTAVDSVTDIFNWLYYGFLYAGLRFSAGVEKKKALAVTIIAAVLMTGVGLIIMQIAA